MQITFSKRKIHYLYLILAVVSIILAGVSYARAATTDPASARPSAEARMANGQAIREERKATMSTELQNRFINLVRNAANRMEAAIVRLENVAGRIETRIAKLEAEGVDTAEALASLSDAKNKLGEAKSALAQVRAEAENALVSDSPRERFKVARERFTNIRGSIRESYIFLREALSALKDAVKEAELNRGVSSAVTNSNSENSGVETTQ